MTDLRVTDKDGDRLNFKVVDDEPFVIAVSRSGQRVAVRLEPDQIAAVVDWLGRFVPDAKRPRPQDYILYDAESE